MTFSISFNQIKIKNDIGLTLKTENNKFSIRRHNNLFVTNSYLKMTD